jgi:hypothetical protein
MDIISFFVIAFQLIVLHRIDGAEIAVNPAQVTSLHAKATGPDRNKLTTHEAHCIVWLADGKLLAVLETCDQVKAMLESVDPLRR